MFKWYDQNKEYFTRNWCSIYGLFNILQLQWWIQVEDKFIVKTLKKAEQDKVWNQSWGSYFSIIYNWFVEQILIRTWLVVQVRTVNILSDDFEELYYKDYWFGLWLKIAWRWYNNASKDWKIDFKETDISIADYTELWHHHIYGKAKHSWVILDSLWSTVWRPIKMDLEVLREAVRKWIYYQNARTLVLKNQRLDYWLRFFKRRWVIKDVESLSKADRKEHDRALKLRVFKK
jgi:hypothetical protein